MKPVGNLEDVENVKHSPSSQVKAVTTMKECVLQHPLLLPPKGALYILHWTSNYKFLE